MLIVLGGLPGTGKTTVARALAQDLSAVYLRLDVIEHSLRNSNQLMGDIGPLGYVMAYDLAASNLALGHCVVVDCVNPLPVTRQAWQNVAMRTPSRLLQVELQCTDRQEHRRRVEQRKSDIPGFRLPTWPSVVQHEYEAWTGERLLIDTARTSPQEAVAKIAQTAQREPSPLSPPID